ncbi:rcc01693 family protein [Halocynthiibacter namhaensis]|uniref:rcc01693 family protein n=1 Tax=Halocynthiibacter namhaensis TaxID=1290553 RepID=UPI00057960BC|nr:rcc01693 family protein [Halocynthiibacter namhaensis]
MSEQGFDWTTLMRAGMRGAGLKPWDFWRLTPAELMLMLGHEGQGRALSRGRLDELLADFPDEPASTVNGPSSNGEYDGGI